ncbi:hypothetical protein [Sphingomonas sp. PL20]|uniref:hypothetical protein n=1 Tax=Sphingomonas sp. PL20 TaxID=2760712 RepID=UPI001AE98331
MTKMKFAGRLLQTVAAIGIATAGISAASAQSNGGSMGGMKMAPGDKMDMKSKKAAPKKAAHHKGGHKGAAKHK